MLKGSYITRRTPACWLQDVIRSVKNKQSSRVPKINLSRAVLEESVYKCSSFLEEHPAEATRRFLGDKATCYEQHIKKVARLREKIWLGSNGEKDRPLPPRFPGPVNLTCIKCKEQIDAHFSPGNTHL